MILMGKTKIAKSVGRVNPLNEILKKPGVRYVDLKVGRTQDGAGVFHNVWVLIYEEDDDGRS